MAIALSSIIAGSEAYKIQKEQDLRPTFTQICAIDPDGILQIQPDYFPETHQGRENISDELLLLHARLERLVGLLANASHFGDVLGQNQVVGIGELKDGLRTIPQQPVALDLLKVQAGDKLPPLLLIGLEASDVYGMSMINVEFFPDPEWVPGATPESPEFFLREKRRGERTRPSFYTDPRTSQGTGRLDCESWRAGQSPVFFLLTYEPNNESRISRPAVDAFDEYLRRLDLETGEMGVP